MTEDLRAAGALLGRGGAATVRTVRDTHRAIARRAFTLAGPGGVPVRAMHDAISAGVYATVAGSLRLAGALGGVAASSRAARGGTAAPLRDHAQAGRVLGAVNGAWGDLLQHAHPPLALPMTARRDGADLPLDPAGLARALPTAGDDVVVFLHGLCETDLTWRYRAADLWADPASTHGSRLAAATGCTDVYVRYNTGRHVSDNGADLSDLLDALVAAWPVPVRRLTLVGHSMGGLVIRSACTRSGTSWLPLTQRVVYLGSPHLGAPLELAAAAVGVALRRLPETRPLGRALASRSAGIKDLRHGDIRAEDRAGLSDLDAWRPEPVECAPLLETATHYYVGATVTERHDHPVARMIGDALVTWPSAAGRNRRRALGLDVEFGRHLGGLHHFDLLNHPRVWAVLHEWLVDREGYGARRRDRASTAPAASTNAASPSPADSDVAPDTDPMTPGAVSQPR